MSGHAEEQTEAVRAFGRPSAAARREPALGPAGDASSAAWRADGASTGWCKLRAASVTGVRHRLAGRPGEDSYAWAAAGDRVVVAVTDGLGSEPGAAGAATRAAPAATSAAVGHPAEDLEGAVSAALDAANRAAEGGGRTTVVVAVVERDGRAVVGRVGDSTAFLLAGEGRAEELFGAPDPDRTDQVTMAVPAAEMDPEIRHFGLGAGAVLALVSDGIADPWRDGPTTVGPALVSALASSPSPLDLLALADFSRHGCHDDRTIVCVWAVPATDPAEG